MVGPGGAAPTLMPEKDVGPNGTEFNTSRLSFKPEFPERPVYDSPALTEKDVIENSSIEFNGSRVSWDGTTNDRGEEYGYISFNVSNRTDKIAFELYDASGFFSRDSVGIFLTNEDNETISLTTLKDVKVVDLSGAEYDTDNIEVLEIRVGNVDSWVDVSGQDVTAETGFFDSIVDFIQFGYQSLTAMFSLLGAYIEFALLLPGGIGYIVLGYLGVMVSYLLLKEGWIG